MVFDRVRQQCDLTRAVWEQAHLYQVTNTRYGLSLAHSILTQGNSQHFFGA